MLSKANIIMDKGACSMAGLSTDTIKDAYITSIDHIGVMTNSKQSNTGINTFYPARFVARIEFTEPLQPQGPRMAMPPRGGLSS